MAKNRIAKRCPAVAVVEEFRSTAAVMSESSKAEEEARGLGLYGSAAYDYVEGRGLPAGANGVDPWLNVHDKIRALANVKKAATSKAGAIAALKLITEGVDGFRLDVEMCEELATIALRHFEPEPGADAG